MTEPKLRLLQYNDRLKTVFLHDIFKKITRKNKGNIVTNVITNSAKEGLLPQRAYFDKDVANKDNTEGYFIIEEGDFVYNPRKSAEAPYCPFGRYNFSGEGIVSPLYTCLKLIDKNEINSDFLLYYFKSPAWYRYVYANGDTGVRHDRVSIKDDTLLDMPIHIPDKDEQIKVVQLFKSIDDVIGVIKRDVLLWEEKKKGVMQKIFSQGVRFKKEDGSDYSEWTNTCITDMAETYIGLVTTMTSHYVERGVPLIRNSDIRENKFFFSNPIFLDEEFAEKNKSRKHKINDIITVHTGDVGTSAIIDKSLDGSIGFATIVTRLNDTSKYLPSYICWYYNSSICKRNILDVITGDGRNNLNMRDFNLLRIPIPCVDEQKKIADCLSSIDEVIQIKKQKLEIWKNIRKGLLQQMFV